MDRRTKILAIGFGVVIVYVLLSKVVYPNWVKPLLTIDERVAERKIELQRLEETQKAVDDARAEYRDYVARNGSFEPRRVETSVRDRINELIEKHKLEGTGVAPARPVEDRKTGLTTAVITVTAVGTLESAVSFLQDVSELPELIRVGNLALYPASTGRKNEKRDLVNVRLPVEIMVLPQNKVVGRIDEASLQPRDSVVRHSGKDYSEIWKRTPFTEYVDLPPVRVDVQRMANFEVGQQAFLQATPSGGEGNYTILWTPPEGLTEPGSARTGVDTSTPRTQTYTVTVTDTARDSKPASATVAVTVKEPKPPTQPVETQVVERPPPPPVEKRDPDARTKQIVMTLLQSAGTNRTRELMVVNSRNKETTYHRAGEDFDGGKLIFVHQTGGLVRTKDKYYVYPLGMHFEERLDYQAAADFPELMAAVEKAIALENARAEAARKKSAIDPESFNDDPAGAHPTVDSRGGDEAPASGDDAPEEAALPSAKPAITTAPATAPPVQKGGEGPIITDSHGQQGPGDALVGPPADQTKPARAQPAMPQPSRAAQKPQVTPAPATQNPTEPPRGGNTRPKPKKGRGRL